MSKGSKRRPTTVSKNEETRRWQETFSCKALTLREKRVVFLRRGKFAGWWTYTSMDGR